MKILRNFLTKSEGSISFLGAVGLVTLLVATAVAVDMTRYMTVKSSFRNALDQATLSAASLSTTTDEASLRTSALKFFQANIPTNYKDNVNISNFTITFDPASYTWHSEATAQLSLAFADALGLSDVTLTHNSTVRWDEINMEVVFAVDMSASMCAKFETASRSQGILKVQDDPNCTKLKYVKDALTYLILGDGGRWQGLPIVVASNGQAGFKVGIVPFNHKIKFPDVQNIPPELTAQEPDPNYFRVFNADPGAAENTAYPLAPITPLIAIDSAAAKQRLQQSIHAINTRFDVPGWTRSNLAMTASAMMLDPAYTQYFGGTAPNNIGARNTEKVVLLLTDGANMGCCYSDHPSGTFENQYLYTYKTDNDNLYNEGQDGRPSGICPAMQAQGYRVYTIVYDVENSDAQGGGAVIKGIMKNCATGPENVNYFDLKLDEGEKIKEAYQTIARDLVRIRLIQ